MKRLWLYPTSTVALFVLVLLGQWLVVPSVLPAAYRYGMRKDVANFVACEDRGTNGLVIIDAGYGNDGVGVFIASVTTDPRPEPFPERSGPPTTKAISERRLARIRARADNRTSALLTCFLKEIPWGEYLKLNIVDVQPHYGWRYGNTDMSGTLSGQLIFRNRCDIQTLATAYASGEPGHPGGMLLANWVDEDRVIVVDLARLAVFSGLGPIEVKEGDLSFDDIPERTMRIAKLLSVQDTTETPLGVTP